MLIKKIKIGGKVYKLQHPGARSYFKKSKELRYATTEGYLQWDNEKLFDYAFGSGGAGQIVFPESGGRVEWEKAGLEDGENVPTVEQLEDAWAVVLTTFLSGKFTDSKDKNWEWIEDNQPSSKSVTKENIKSEND